MTDRHSDGRDPAPDRPRAPPEIIPPGETGRQDRDEPRIFISIDEEGARRIYLARPGPFTIVLALAVLGLIGVVILIVLLSVALIWIPVVIVLIVAFVLSITLRQYWWRFRHWLARR